MTDDLRLRERVSRAAEGTTPTPTSRRWFAGAGPCDRRRVGGTIAIAIVLVLGVAVPLSMLTGLREDREPATPGTSEPGPSPSEEPTSSPTHTPADEPVVIAPSGWFVQEDPLPALISPRIPFAAGTYDFPRPPCSRAAASPPSNSYPRTTSSCGSIATRRQMPRAQTPDDIRRGRIGSPSTCRTDTAMGSAPPEPPTFADYRFWATDHTVQVLVGIGADASDRLLRELEDVVSSYEP